MGRRSQARSSRVVPRGHVLACASIAAAVIALAGAGSAVALPATPWTGKWDVGGGQILTLNQSGLSITGTSPRACDANPTGITVRGTVTSPDGSKAHFSYSGAPACPGEGGTVDAVMSADARTVRATGVTQYGSGFTQTWRYVGGGTEPRSTPASGSGCAGKPLARIIKVRGDNAVIRAGSGTGVAAKVGDTLCEGDDIAANPFDGEVVIQMPDTGTLRIGKAGIFRITKHEVGLDNRIRTEARLRQGELEADIRPRPVVSTDFSVTTPQMGGSVKGTSFVVFVDAVSKATVVSVKTGVVEVDPVKAGLATVKLTAGKEVEVTAAAISTIAPLGKAGAVGGLNRAKAIAFVLKRLARSNRPCKLTTPRGGGYSARPAAGAWLVSVKVAGKVKGWSTWRVFGSKATPQNALAKKVAAGCK